MLRYLFSLLKVVIVSVTVRHLLNTLLLYCLTVCYIFQQKTDDGNNSVMLVQVPPIDALVVPQFLYSDLLSDPNHFSCWLSGSEKFWPLFYLYLGKTQARRHTTWSWPDWPELVVMEVVEVVEDDHVERPEMKCCDVVLWCCGGNKGKGDIVT